MIQDKPMPNVAFRGMAFALRLMEPFKHSKERLIGAGLEKARLCWSTDVGLGVTRYLQPRLWEMRAVCTPWIFTLWQLPR